MSLDLVVLFYVFSTVQQPTSLNNTLVRCRLPRQTDTRSHAVFRTVDDGKNSLLLPKLLYSLLNLAGVCVGLWKMAKMGLLPVTAADWTSYLVPKHAIEHSGVPL